jgi:hypothetical protein
MPVPAVAPEPPLELPALEPPPPGGALGTRHNPVWQVCCALTLRQSASLPHSTSHDFVTVVHASPRCSTHVTLWPRLEQFALVSHALLHTPHRHCRPSSQLLSQLIKKCVSPLSVVLV